MALSGGRDSRQTVIARAAAGGIFGAMAMTGARLGLQRAHQRRITERLLLAVDHVLYGVVLAGQHQVQRLGR